MNWKMGILVALVAVIGLGLVKDKGFIQQKKSYHELPISEQKAIQAGCWKEWMRVDGQVRWRYEQAVLYRRWDSARMYQEMLAKMEDIRQLLGDGRSDPTVLWDDIHKIDTWLKTGQ